MILRETFRGGTRDLPVEVLACGERLSDGLRYLLLEVDFTEHRKSSGQAELGLPNKSKALVREWNGTDDWKWVWGYPVKLCDWMEANPVGTEGKASNRRLKIIEFTEPRIEVDTSVGDTWVSY